MGLRMHKHPNRRLFHYVDRSYDGSDVIVTFVPDREDEARASVAGILPRLTHECGPQVQKMFKPDAVALHSESCWDAATCQVRTKDNDRVFTPPKGNTRRWIFPQICNVHWWRALMVRTSASQGVNLRSRNVSKRALPLQRLLMVSLSTRGGHLIASLRRITAQQWLSR